MSLRLISTFLFVLASYFQAVAQDVSTISYQGSLEVNGSSAHGSYIMTATLYADEAGTKPVWSGTYATTLERGIFNLQLGSGGQVLPKSLPAILWLGIRIGEDAELKPYTKIASVPSALQAKALEGGAVTSINGQQGEVVFKAGTGTMLEAEGNTITISSQPVIKQDQQDVAHSVIGTQYQVLAAGTYGVQQSGDVTLSLPQNIHTGATPQFTNVNLTGIPSGSSYTNVVVSNGGVLQTRTISSLAAGVTSVTGTSNQVNVSSSTGDVTLSLPQNIHSGATPTFANATLTGMPGSSTSTNIVVSNAGVLETRTFASFGGSGWSLTGNSGTTAGTNFIGTTDNQALYFDVNNAPRLILNTSAGIQRDAGGNTRGAVVTDLQISRNLGTQIVSGNYSMIGSGHGNTNAADFSVIGGGNVNAINAGQLNAIGGGSGNTITAGQGNTIAGGGGNVVRGNDNFIGGGAENQIPDYTWSAIAGGYRNNATSGSFVGAGNNNTAAASSVVGGGSNNFARYFGFVGGGKYNIMADHTDYSLICGGDSNEIGDGVKYSAIAGGRKLKLRGNHSFGFNAEHNTGITSIDAVDLAYFGNVDLWLGNVDNIARALRFYEPNTSYTFSGTNYTAFKAQAQSVNVIYTLPASQGAANQVLTNDGSGNLSWSSTPKLSTGSVASADGGTTIPDNISIVRLTSGASAAFNYTLPSGAAGQLLYVYNNSGFQANNGAANIPDGSTYIFVYINSGWRRAQ